MDFLTRALDSYPLLIDFVLYFFVFGAAARVSFAKAFPNHEGKVLSIAVGMFLAAGLAIAQRKLGFSTENMGPVAVFFLCTVIFVASFKFLQSADVGKPMTIFVSTMLVIVMLRVTMPKLASRFLRDNPMTVVLVLFGLIIWMWYTSGAYAKKMDRRKPGQMLARNRVVPDDNILKKEKRFVKKALKGTTKKDRREENAAGREMTYVLDTVEKEGINNKNQSKLLAMTDKILKRAEAVRERTTKLIRLDDALKRFDLKWFHRTHSANLSQMTPAQQKIMQENIIEERRRIHVEEEMEKLELETDLHIRTMQDHVKKCRGCLSQGNAAGAAGWLTEALEEQKRTRQIEDKILDWEQRLLKLIKREKKEIDQAS
jgi:hypothetical protein